MLDWLFISPETQTVHPKLAEKLLRALCFHLPESFRNYQQYLENGQPLIQIVGDISLSLGQLIGQQKARLQQLEYECQSARNELWYVSQQRDAMLSDPLRQRMVDVQAEIQTLSARAEKAELALTNEQYSRTAEQKVWQQEEKRLKAQIADQNKVIARQQLRLSQLLGDASGVDSTGGKPS